MPKNRNNRISSSCDYLLFWGKAHAFENASSWHPAAYHCLDVAACGRVLLEHHQLWRERLGELLHLDEESLLDFVTFLLAVHDVGKFSKPFQIKAPQYWPERLLKPCEKYHGNGLPHHDTAGWWLWRNKVEDGFSDRFIGIDDYKFDPLLKAVMGHHGTPPEEDLSKYTDPQIGHACIESAIAFASDAAKLCLSAPVDLTGVDGQNIKSASWALAGLTTLADWTGSNQHWFEYTEPKRSLEQYWQEVALPKAQTAIAKAGLKTKPSAATVSYGNFFESQVITPSPMQRWAETVPLTDGPGLYLIEDMTGSGKTEAALMLTHRLMAAGKADGLFFALPTQATANAMYDRLQVAYSKLFEEGAIPSLILAHGGRDLSEKFTASILQGFADNRENDSDGADDSDLNASAQCAAWIADDRRLAFLADVGAGTIDQALLSILPSRHQALRLAGLMRRVLILDEIHAYDAYMQQEINTLLAFHKALGGSTILLSATLPHEMKTQLCKTYDGEAEILHSAPANLQNAPYPLAIVVSDGGTKTTPVEPRNESIREVPVQFLSSPEVGMERVRAAAKEGQAVLYIRNTVKDAIETFDTLSDEIENISLFHARFAFCDRLHREKNAVETFGKHSKADARRGQVLIATQVVEQSLDIDFDLIVSDLAPIDLLIQRAGRLWRHQRENRPGKCEFLVVSPAPVAEPDEKWLHALLPGTAAVYRDHARLWLTAKALQEAGSIRSPDNLRALIESVYGLEAEDNIPAALMSPFYDFEGQNSADKAIAKINCLKLSTGYTRDGGKWESDERTPTRLGDPTTTFRLARQQSGQLVPWAAGQGNNIEEQHLWRLSEVRLSVRLADEELIPAEFTEQAKVARESWGKWQDDIKLLILRESDISDFWEGAVFSGEKEKEVVYSPVKGLILKN